jgi:hypothetical protein
LPPDKSSGQQCAWQASAANPLGVAVDAITASGWPRSFERIGTAGSLSCCGAFWAHWHAPPQQQCPESSVQAQPCAVWRGDLGSARSAKQGQIPTVSRLVIKPAKTTARNGANVPPISAPLIANNTAFFVPEFKNSVVFLTRPTPLRRLPKLVAV